MCFGNQHTFAWGSSTAVDATPLSLRCSCGAMSREDIAPLQRLRAENARLREWIEPLEAWASNVLEIVKERRIPSADVIADGEVIVAQARKALS